MHPPFSFAFKIDLNLTLQLTCHFSLIKFQPYQKSHEAEDNNCTTHPKYEITSLESHPQPANFLFSQTFKMSLVEFFMAAPPVSRSVTFFS